MARAVAERLEELMRRDKELMQQEQELMQREQELMRQEQELMQPDEEPIQLNEKIMTSIMRWDLSEELGIAGRKVLAMLDGGVEPRLATVGSGSATLVHYACSCGWLDFVKSLIQEHNCDPHTKTQNGVTPLHCACACGRFDIVRYLTSEQHCDPDCCDDYQQTPLHWLSGRDRKCTQEEAVKIVRFLISLGKCDLNKRDEDGRTALLLACRHEVTAVARCLIAEGHCDVTIPDNNGDTALHVCRSNETDFGISQLLLEEAKIDPNAKNSNGDTPLHLACGGLENSTLVQLLVRDERCNPNEKNSKGDTALHVACRHSWNDKIGKLLLEDARIDTNAKNNDGHTPLHLACKGKNSVQVQLLMRDERCNPNEKDSKGDTALHIVSHHSPDVGISEHLLEGAKIDPNAKNSYGNTPLHLACSRWNLTLAKLLVRDERCNPNEKDSNGDTALHVACRVRWGPIPIPKVLLEGKKVDPNVTDSNGRTPLDLTSRPDVIRELIRHGANPQDVYKTHGKVLGKYSSKKPLETPVKLFMVGNPSAGKSTLIKALQSELTGFRRLVTRSKPVSGVDEKTAGIVPHEFESKIYGRVTLYDFAGQREFYGSHAALLQNAIQTSTPIFLLVVDLSKIDEDIKRNIFYWLSFLENQCTSVSSKPHLVAVGSHADILKATGGDPKRKGSLLTAQAVPQFPSLEFAGFVAMDCQYADSSGMKELHHILKTSCDSLRMQENINFNAHCFLVYLLDKFREATAITIQQIQSAISEGDVETIQEDDINYFLPQTSMVVEKVCDQLNDRGHLLVLKNPTAIETSWVIINRTALLAEVNGTIFAPEGFKEHIKLASSTGVVPLSSIAKHFPTHDLTMLVGFLSHLEFCHEISDLEILGLISQEQASTAGEATSVQGECYFFFPGLVTLKVPSTVWEPQPQFAYHCGWMLQFCVLGQFFFPRFVQVLLLRLAFSFAFAQDALHIKEDVPTLQRKCSVWKNGIYWGNAHGIETLVEIAEQNRVVVLMRCSEVKSECLQLRSLLMQKVLAAAREFCSKVSTVESFIIPSETTEYPLKPTSELTHISIESIASIMSKGIQSASVPDSTGKPVSLDSLLSFEPYADLGEPILREFFAKDKQKRLNIFSIAERIPDKNTEMIKKIFKPSPTQLRERMSGAPIASPVYHVLDIWRASCEGTYQCLREKLDQFSVFAGRNPLEIGGVSCESRPEQPSTDVSAAVTPEIAPGMEHGPTLLAVAPKHVDMLAALLDDLAGSWYRFTGLLGLSEGKRDQVQLDNAWKPRGSQLCLMAALHLWVKSDVSATYEKITTILQKHFPDRSLSLITAVRGFAEQRAPEGSPKPPSTDGSAAVCHSSEPC